MNIINCSKQKENFLLVRIAIFLFGVLFFYRQFIFPQSSNSDAVKLAGFRASRVNTSYPGNQFPNDNYWVYVGDKLAGKFSTASPSSIWIVSLYDGNGYTRLGFPYQSNSTQKILGSDSDDNESYLNRFDREGFKIFLQVEPGSADVDSLIDIVLSRYGHHSCVIGFGVDIEWYQADKFDNGNKVTDEIAQRWENHLKSINPNYKLFLKHYWSEWMPPTYRGDIIFVDDGQQYQTLAEMKEDFKNWSAHFQNNKVGYQYGYPADEKWWLNLNDPAKAIGDTLLSAIPNIYGLYWVDFTITKIFPMTTTGISSGKTEVKDFQLFQNYPNPFNPSTAISFQLSAPSRVSLKVFDILGREITTLVDEEKPAGNYKVIFDANTAGGGLPSGIYFYRLATGTFVETKKMSVIK